MENANKQICRLCLEVILHGDCEVIEESKKEILDILLIKIDFDISDDAVSCKKCLVKLQNCYDFKSNCFYMNDYVTPFVDGDVKVDIKNASEKVTMSSEISLDNSQICRLCMSFIEDETFNCYTSDLKDMIRYCLPDVNLNSVDEPLVCKPCLSNMIKYYEFMKSCEEVEQKIKNYIQEGEEHGIASKIILEDIVELKECGTLSKPSEKQCLDVENETECLKNEEATNIKCEEIEIKDELDIGVEMSETIKLGNDDSSKKNGSLKKTNIGKCSTKGRIFCCPKCPYSGNQPYRLKNHMQTHLNNKVYTCTLCSFVTDARLSLKAHLTIVHRGPTKAFGCHECPYETDYKNHLEQHLLTHKDKSEVEMRKCLLCSYENKYKSALWQHQKLEHSKNIKMYECEKCSFSTKRKASMAGHQLLHKNPEEIPKHKCEKCDFQTRYKNSLVKHMLMHEDLVRKFTCEKCPYRCKRQQDFLEHMMNPCGKQAFSCDQCTYFSNRKGHLQRHKRVHQKDGIREMYKCEPCNYQAKTSTSLRNHMIKIHMDPSKVPTFECALCPYKSILKRNLSKHITRCHHHKDQSTLECTLCNYVSKKTCDLQRHMKLHQTVKLSKFKCNECEYSTWRKDHLNQHKLRHVELSETIAYKCAMCDYQTKYKFSLRKHIKRCYLKKKNNKKTTIGSNLITNLISDISCDSASHH